MSVPEPSPDLDPAAAPAPAPAPGPAPDAVTVTPEPGARRLPRAVGVALSVAGLLAVTATSAAVTVAVGKPDPAKHVAAVAPVASASASASATASASPTPSPSPTPTPTVAPRPASTLQGSVSGGKHSGDLRYFLLPVPDTADPYGAPDGAMLSIEDLQAQYSKDTDIKGVLDSWGYKEAAERTYRTRDGKMEVRTELMRFGRTDRAQGFADNSSFNGDSFDVDGVSGARGYVLKPEQQAYTGTLFGIGVSGDVVYKIYIDVQGDPDKALLSDAMKRERDRLANG